MSKLPPTLNLLVPWDLPTSLSLTPEEQRLVQDRLNVVLRALRTPSVREGVNILKLAQQQLETADVEKANLSTTKTSLRLWEVEDFDDYFHVRHVETESPALCLAEGLLLAVQAFLELCQKTPSLPFDDIELQIQGFLSYIQLLKRVCQLD